MKKLIAFALLFNALVAFAQNKEQRTIPDFSGLSIATGIQAEITQGTENTVTITVSNEKYLANIKTVVENGMLKIYYDNRNKLINKEHNRKLQVFVTYKSIDRLVCSSGANVTATNTVTAVALSLDLSSGAHFSGDIKTSDLNIDQSSGAMCKLSGAAANVKADISSGSIFTGNDMQAETCKAAASSGAVFKISVSKKLVANASSGGVVKYNGTPDLEKSESSGGIISKI